MRTPACRTNDRCVLDARAQRGVSLVELMVALTLGLFVVGGAASIYLANRNSFATVEGVARVGENARFAAELLARDIREAGNLACGGAMYGWNLASPVASANWAGWERGLLGNPMGASDVLAVSVASPSGKLAQVTSPFTDSLLVWSASSGSTPIRFTAHTIGSTGTFTTPTTHSYKVGDVLVACDGRRSLTFDVQSVTDDTVSYGNGDAITKQFSAGGFLSPLTTRLWYVGGSEEGTAANALRRITLNKDGVRSVNEEIVTGVSQLQIKYLSGDASGTPDPAASYQSAAAVASWTNVIAAQLTLTLTSLEKINPTGATPSVFSYQLPLTVGIRTRQQP